MTDSEGESIECWENYTAGEVLVQGLAGQIHQQDVEAIIRAQKQMLQRFEKTNEMLINCNALSASRYATAQQEFAKHSSTLHNAKKDLDYIFKKIRSMKTKLHVVYPGSSAAVIEKLDHQENRRRKISEDHVDTTTTVRKPVSSTSATTSSYEEKTNSDENTFSSAVERLACNDPSISDGDSSRSNRSVNEQTGKQMQGGEQNHLDNKEDSHKGYEEAIKAGKVRVIGNRLHHVSSSDDSSSSAKSNCSTDS